jgi:hypothetical protein
MSINDLGDRQWVAPNEPGTRPNANCRDRIGKLIHNIERERRMLTMHSVYTTILSFDEL